ncbi:Vacuolar protein sorting-associated protein 13-like, N-terminal domain [Dillenia turbinata]|uniref:Autophagy-related protein 2 n=1 Tax=Dillenia turbinata TaxID=194707 RepID=A0AAN8W4Q2_9MAGN
MFRWNIARSAEKMVSKWFIRRACKFLLKKKLGKFILGDIDLDQLNVQLSDGTIQLSDLALNVDYVNQKFGASAAVIVKEGSIGLLLIKMPWKGRGCEVVVDELELVLAPCDRNKEQALEETSVPCQDGKNYNFPGKGRLEHEAVDQSTTPTSLEVHEGVKTIAKMVKHLLSSFHVVVKKLLVAFDPCLEKNESKTRIGRALVLRITGIEVGTRTSEDAGNSDNFLGTSQLTSFVKFQGAIFELLKMDDVDDQTQVTFDPGTASGGCISGCTSNVTTPILMGEHGGFSGTLKLSIPWRNGSLDMHKVDADVYIDPMELKFTPSSIQWLLYLWDLFMILVEDGHMSQCQSTAVGTTSSVNDKLKTIDSPASEFYSSVGEESGRDALVPGSQFISDWVPLSKDGDQRDGEEPDFGASIDQFFECLDEMRSSQSALGNSGMWNWTYSVFSTITAASNLASGSLHISTEQQHVETNFKATIAGISVLFSLNDEDTRPAHDLNNEKINICSSAHYLTAECQHILLILEVCPRETKFEATVEHIEVADHFSPAVMEFGLHGRCTQVHDQNLSILNMQADVQGALPPCVISPKEPDTAISPGLVDPNSAFTVSDITASRTTDTVAAKEDVVRVTLLKTSGTSHLRFSSSSSYLDGSLIGQTSFVLKLPPFILWVNFHLIRVVLDLSKDIERSSKVNVTMNDYAIRTTNDEQNREVKRNPSNYIATLAPKQSLKGNIFVPIARVILCFPFDNGREVGSYLFWNQFIALDFSSPSVSNNGLNQDIYSIQDSSFQKSHSSTNSRAVHLNVGNLDIYLITSAHDDNSGTNHLQRPKFCAENIMSVMNGSNCSSVISMHWQDGSVTGPQILKTAKLLATSEDLRSSKKLRGKGYVFATFNTAEDIDSTRQEIVQSSAFLIHVHLSPVTINLSASQYRSFIHLLKQAADDLSCFTSDSPQTGEDDSVSQTSIVVECDSLEVLVCLDVVEENKGSVQQELPGSWHHLKLKIMKLELLAVSNIGGLKDASFLWVAHGKGKLWGSITGAPGQELLLISCSNSTMRRGNGEGSNALSSRFAGSDIIHMWDPESCHSFTSITVRCGTIVGIGGRLDWFGSIFSFFTVPSAESEKATDKNPDEGNFGRSESGGSSFVLNLEDIGLSYEPFAKNSVVNHEGSESEFDPVQAKEEKYEQHISALLSASSFSLSNTTKVNCSDIEYKIRLQDLGLLICAASGLENDLGTYSVEHLRKLGYVKVAGLELLEAILKTNCSDGLLWEIESHESHIFVDTCHDTTSALMRLLAQFQRLFAPDVEESIVHLQTRWNNVQQAQRGNEINDEATVFSSDSEPSTSQVLISDAEAKNSQGLFGLMDEICEDAFHLDANTSGQPPSFGSPLNASFEGSPLGEACNFQRESPKILSDDLCFSGPVPEIGFDSNPFQNGCSPELIEGYCWADLRPLSELSVSSQPLSDNLSHKSENTSHRDIGRKHGGWYKEASLKIVENHISDVSEQNGPEQSAGLHGSSNCRRPDKAKGRAVFKNMKVRWRMYAGSDWLDLGNALHSMSTPRRDTTSCLELELSKMDFQYDIFPDGDVCVSKLSLSIQDFHLCDNSRDAPWKQVLGLYHSRNHPRGSSSKAFKMDLEAVRPDPSTPLEEYRLHIALLPMLLHLHQGQLDFLISFFGGKSSPMDQSSHISQDSEKPKVLVTRDNCCGGHCIAEEALLPYFQKFDIWPLLVRVDYSPSHVDLAALRGGKYVELVNLVPWKGVELQLKHVHAVGVYGWSSVCETIIGEWLEDISQNQIHKLLRGLPTIRSIVAVGSGAAKLVSLPIKNYKKDRRLLKGMQRGTIAFLRSISLEAVGLGVHLAAGAHEILLQAEYIMTSIPPSVPWNAQSRVRMNVRSNQPKNAKQGIRRAYESLSDGLGKSASALVRTPLKTYQRGEGAGSALVTAVKAAPVAAIAPASAAARAVHYTLLGVRNSLDPEHKKESMEKYLGPSRHNKEKSQFY